MLGRVRAGTGSSWLKQRESWRGADPVERGCAAGSHHPLGCMEPAFLGRDPPWPRGHRNVCSEVYANAYMTTEREIWQIKVYLGVKGGLCLGINSKQFFNQVQFEFRTDVGLHLETVIHGAVGLRTKKKKTLKKIFERHRISLALKNKQSF